MNLKIILAVLINALAVYWVHLESRNNSIYVIEEMGKVIVDHEKRLSKVEETYI